MPYKAKGKCVYKKDTGKKVGCTTGPVKKYLAALNINAHEAKKPMKSFKDYYTELSTLGGQKITDDTTVTAEGEYAQGQDQINQPGGYDSIGFSDNGPTFTAEGRNKNTVINKCIEFLEKINKNGIPTDSNKLDMVLAQLKKFSKELLNVGIEPTDIEATLKNPRMMKQYLITGPSAPGGGGKGALRDLKDIKAGLLMDDEDSPGGPDVNADPVGIDLNVKSSADTDANNFNDSPEGSLEEGIHDARHPGRLKRLATKRFGKGKITCSKASAMARSKDTLTKKQANRFLNYHCR